MLCSADSVSNFSEFRVSFLFFRDLRCSSSLGLKCLIYEVLRVFMVRFGRFVFLMMMMAVVVGGRVMLIFPEAM